MKSEGVLTDSWEIEMSVGSGIKKFRLREWEVTNE